jgi:Glucodextranase, domain N
MPSVAGISAPAMRRRASTWSWTSSRRPTSCSSNGSADPFHRPAVRSVCGTQSRRPYELLAQHLNADRPLDGRSVAPQQRADYRGTIHRPLMSISRSDGPQCLRGRRNRNRRGSPSQSSMRFTPSPMSRSSQRLGRAPTGYFPMFIAPLWTTRTSRPCTMWSLTDTASLILQTRDLTYTVSADPTGMACTVLATSATHGYQLVTTYVADPARDAVVTHTTVRDTHGPAPQGLKLYIRLDAHRRTERARRAHRPHRAEPARRYRPCPRLRT